jgi:hypothetical protein
MRHGQQFAHVGELEYADLRGGKRPASSIRSFRRFLATLDRPPKNASIETFRLWHDVRLNGIG